ncbi:MAG: radical SAM protein [Acidobacteria bacterium]|nr:radical SAM protein [Acidobacteriota bacterium]
MSNVSITQVCTRDCGYCFSRPVLRAGPSRPHMTPALFERALDYLERSGLDLVPLLGGEPTSHPNFAALVGRALSRGFRVLVFSNGEMPGTALRALASAPEGRATVLINATGLVEMPEGRRAAIRATLTALRGRAGLGFTIDSPAFDTAGLLDWVDEFELDRNIRVGLAHPVAGATNRYLRPRQYRAAGRRLSEFAAEAAGRGVALDYDCGFVPCMFPDGECDDEVGLRCGPIPDLLPDGNFVACYPLAPLHSEPLNDGSTQEEVRCNLSARFAAERQVGIFPERSVCEERAANRCAGGCLAAAMLRFRSAPEDSKRPANRPAERWAIPYIDQPAEFWQRLAAEFPSAALEVYFPLPEEVIGSGRPVQVAPRVVRELERLGGEYGIRRATVSNLLLAARIKEALPDFHLTASTLMDIADGYQLGLIDGVCDTVVPATRIMRDLAALRRLRTAFPGRIRLLVNEACLPACPYRTQHFHEMGGRFAEPKSLCEELLEKKPWLRMTGAWVLPQHLHLFDGLYDELKLAGRATLHEPEHYREVLGAYIFRRPLTPNAIGGGPASVLQPMTIDAGFYRRTLECGRQCNKCDACAEYFGAQMEELTHAGRKREPAPLLPILGA